MKIIFEIFMIRTIHLKAMPDIDEEPRPGVSGYNAEQNIEEGAGNVNKTAVPPKKKNVKSSKSEPELLFLEDMSKQFGKVSEKIIQDDDENAAWAKMLVIQLRKMDPFEAAVFRLECDSRMIEMNRPKK